MSNQKIPIPRWLEDLQQKSWEPEVLLSGIVLYGMFKVPALLDSFLQFFKLNILDESTDIDNLVALFKMGIYWLIAGLILHLICRGIWIGMVGLSYSFPKGIRMDKLEYKEPFDKKVRNIASYEQIVIRLEKVSSALFSISFMLFMSLIGGYLYFLILIIIPATIGFLYLDLGYNGLGFNIFQIWAVIVFFSGVFGLIDFITLGYFRRFKWVAKLYWPLHRFISIFTLSRFYRPIYYGFATNLNKWLYFLFLFAFTSISIIGGGTMIDRVIPGAAFSRLSNFSTAQGYSSYPGYYDDQNAEITSLRAHIPSDIINGKVLKLFVVGRIAYEENMEKNTPMDSLRQAHPDTSINALKNMVISSFFEVLIDDQPMEDLSWYFNYKDQVNQRGFLTYINISELNEGMHHVVVNGPEQLYTAPFATIPFYRDVAFKGVGQPDPVSRKEDSNPDFQPKPFGIRK